MATALNRRHVRLRREYLYRRSLEGPERELYEKKRKVREALAEGKPIPTELRSEAGEIKRLLEYDDSRLSAAAPGSIDDEYARTLRGERMAKICICTSRDPSSRLKQFAKELKHLFPNATRINRGNTKVSELVDATRSAEFTDLVVVHETRGQPDGLVVSHLPLGPTTYFTLSDCVLRHDIEGAPKFSSDTAPHLIFHDFDESKRLARRIQTVRPCFRPPSSLEEAEQQVLRCLFPAAHAGTKRVVTMYNASDRISFRHHLAKKEGKDVELTELGPRFEMTPYQIKLGTLDAADADTEWVLRPYLNSATKVL